MKKHSVLFFVGCLTMALMIVSCKGKTGPAGSGRTQTVYTGTVPNNIVGLNTVFDISAPALTVNSSVEVRYSSNSVTWYDFGYDHIDVSSKVIHVEIAPDYIDWTYNAVVTN